MGLKQLIKIPILLLGLFWIFDCGNGVVKEQTDPKVRPRFYETDLAGFPYEWKMEFSSPEHYSQIPEGEAPIGAPEEAVQNYPDRLSLTLLEIDDFAIGKYEVRVKDFQYFVDNVNGYDIDPWWSYEARVWKNENNIKAPLDWEAQKANPNHPVTGVSFYEAAAFCKALGLRLPNEFEWEKAAMGNQQQGYVPFPWGTEDQDIKERANLSGQLMDVGQFESGKSLGGCYDLVGNVHEWTSTVYGEFKPNLAGELVGEARICKGSSYILNENTLTIDFRLPLLPDTRTATIGFRVAADSIEQIQRIPQLYHQDDWDEEAILGNNPQP